MAKKGLMGTLVVGETLPKKTRQGRSAHTKLSATSRNHKKKPDFQTKSSKCKSPKKSVLTYAELEDSHGISYLRN